LAQLGAQDIQSERASRMARAGGMAGVGQGYQGLGSIWGQAGTAAGGQQLAQAGALEQLGNMLAGRQLTGTTLPIDYLLNYLSTARGTAVQTPSAFGQITSALGSAAQGAGSLMGGMSDERMKQDVSEGGAEIRTLLDSLNSYEYQYIPEANMGDGKHLGVMAQEMESTDFGKRFVREDKNGTKFIDYGLAFNTMMAVLVDLHKRIKMLEGDNNAS
jgi:hypothetical protein